MLLTHTAIAGSADIPSLKAKLTMLALSILPAIAGPN